MRHAVTAALLSLFATTAALAQGTAFVNWESPQSHPIDRTADGSVIVAVNTADDRLEVFDAAKGALTHRGSVPVGLDPVSVRVAPDGTAWVVNQISDSVSVVDLPTMRVVRTVNVGDEPADIVFAGRPLRAFVTLARPGAVAVFDPTALAPALQTVAVAGASPRALAVSPDGTKVYAAIFESGNHTTVVARAQVNQANGPYGGQNPPPNSGNAFSPERAQGQPVPPRVSQIVRKGTDGVWRDDNNRNWSNFVTWDLHDHDIAVINTANLAVTHISGLMTTVAGLGVSPTGTLMAVGTEAINERRFEQNLNGVFIRVVAATVAPGGSTGTAVDLNPHLDYSQPTAPAMTRLQSVGDPRGVAWMPDGSKALVAGMGSNTVVAVAPSGARLSTIMVGEGPTGLVVSPSGTRAYVLNRFEGSVSVVDPSAGVEVERVNFFDPTPASVRAGRPFLYDTHLTSGLGQASCASCHVDGRSDRIAWDLGDPTGQSLLFDDQCQAPNGCVSWHPMKGPMATQTLMGIIGNEPFHWRGEKKTLADFNVAYTNLQGREAQITAQEMSMLTNYVASLVYAPNPNRNMDGSLRTSVSVAGGTGNAATGQTVFATVPTLPGPPGGGPGLTCTACHPGPVGTNGNIDIPVGPEQQNRKNAQLRDVYRKVGANHASQLGDRGFGFNHHGEEFSIQEILNIGFQFAPGANGQQQRRDIEAFLLSFGTDTHAGVGTQTTARNGGGAGDDLARINQMLAVASAGNGPALVVKGLVGGQQRGWLFRFGAFQSDRASEVTSPAALLALAAPGSELTYTLVPQGAGVRIGVDRDADGYFDGDELTAGSDPADPSSVPHGQCAADIAPITGDGVVDGMDLGTLLSQWGPGGGLGDLNGDNVVNGADLGILLAAWGACAE